VEWNRKIGNGKKRANAISPYEPSNNIGGIIKEYP
jgi:hypothetical protein